MALQSNMIDLLIDRSTIIVSKMKLTTIHILYLCIKYCKHCFTFVPFNQNWKVLMNVYKNSQYKITRNFTTERPVSTFTEMNGGTKEERTDTT
jgi:hypothetical protein